MNYAIIVIAFIVAALQIPDLLSRKPKAKPLTIFILSVIGLGFGIRQEYLNKRDEKYSGNTGTLNGKADKLIEYPAIAIGGAVFTLTGGQKKFISNIDLEIWLENKKLFVNTKIKDKSGNMVAEIVANEWQTNPNNVYEKNFDDRALEVKDNSGNIILQAIYDLQKVTVHGAFYFGTNQGISFAPAPDGGGLVEFLGPSHPSFENLRYIKPVFMYPSKKYPGKRLKTST